MGRIGDGYGSEWQLQTYLKFDSAALNDAVQRATGGHLEDWLQPPASHREWKGMDFLPADNRARSAWPQFWPQTGNVHNWDAVGRLRVGSESRWLLVEAKAHVGEIESTCGAKNPVSMAKIREALDSTKAAIGIEESREWMSPYYQYANRMAALHFLVTQGVPAHLLFVYFIGDGNPSASCPTTEEEWSPSLAAMYSHLGLKGSSEEETRTHSIFLQARAMARP